MRGEHLAIDAFPRFGLVGTDDAEVGARLASLGWKATLTAATLDALDLGALRRCDVIAVVCGPESLSDPAVQAGASRVATPLVAIVKGSNGNAVVDAARLGWRGFVSAEKNASTIARVLATAARGELAFPPSASGALARALASFAPVRRAATSELTPRQRQIVALLAQGATDAEIATTLGISASTAHKHVQNARRRLRARTRSQLVAATQEPFAPPALKAVTE
jgi:DNA-binding NarL/FixJ family response regulator